jgi:hypothetical protein
MGEEILDCTDTVLDHMLLHRSSLHPWRHHCQPKGVPMTVEDQLAARLERRRRVSWGNLSKEGRPANPSHDNEIKIRECMT